MTVTGIITAIVFGLIIGAIARLLVPGKQNIPIWLTIIVGLVGSFAGTFIAKAFNRPTTGWNFWETIFQIIVAVILVVIVSNLWARRGASR
jgi:uncharacterized membrane protein YeaQ/YmgE (transglycosylase-associated protein family)